MPDEILDKNSPAWNKGRVHHTGGPYEVAHAYAAQFDKDMRNFLNARAKELVVGGIMVLIMSTLPDGTSPYRSPPRALYDILESCLMETVKAERQTIHKFYHKLFLFFIVLAEILFIHSGELKEDYFQNS